VGCIGPVTARAARLAGFPVRVEAPDPAPGAWVAAIARAVGGGGTTSGPGPMAP
jgi:uroporphyrinogen-III synthase